MTIRRLDDGREPETRHYDHVIVANGHHWSPRWPEPSFPGSEAFPGEQLHAHYYRTPDVLEDKLFKPAPGARLNVPFSY